MESGFDFINKLDFSDVDLMAPEKVENKWYYSRKGECVYWLCKITIWCFFVIIC